MYTLLILNNLNLLFFFISLVGTTISISSINWFSAWLGLELNILSFIPLIINNKNIVSSEAAIKYFLIQASASAIFLFLCIYNSFYNFIYFFYNTNSINLIIIPLIMKLGAAPFHNWFVIVIQGLPWKIGYLLMTLQKITPLFLINFLFQKSSIILMFAAISSIVGSMNGLGQTSLNKIIAFSSINHLGWILTSNFLRKFLLTIYLIFYFFLNLFIIRFLFDKTIYYFNQIIFNTNFFYWSISILSLAGLPPLVGFLPKWLIIKTLIINEFYFIRIVLILTSLITLIFYLRLIISSITFSSFIQHWNTIYKNNTENFIFPIQSVFSSFTLYGLILYNLFLT